MRWRSLFSRPRQNESEAFDALGKLLMSDALYNRAALNPETLRLYHRMFPEPSEAVDDEEIARLFGQRSFELVSALAQQVGKPVPDSAHTALVFLNKELRGFDTAEATQHREGAVLNALIGLLKG
jgi:hypothetical protein